MPARLINQSGLIISSFFSHIPGETKEKVKNILQSTLKQFFNWSLNFWSSNYQLTNMVS